MFSLGYSTIYKIKTKQFIEFKEIFFRKLLIELKNSESLILVNQFSVEFDRTPSNKKLIDKESVFRVMRKGKISIHYVGEIITIVCFVGLDVHFFVSVLSGTMISLAICFSNDFNMFTGIIISTFLSCLIYLYGYFKASFQLHELITKCIRGYRSI